VTQRSQIKVRNGVKTINGTLTAANARHLELQHISTSAVIMFQNSLNSMTGLAMSITKRDETCFQDTRQNKNEYLLNTRKKNKVKSMFT